MFHNPTWISEDFTLPTPTATENESPPSTLMKSNLYNNIIYYFKF